MNLPLGEMSEIFYGKSPAEVVDTDGSFPIVGTGGEYGRSREYLYKVGIVVPRKGSLGNPQLVCDPFWPTDTTYAVLSKPGFDVGWIYYQLLNFDLTKLNEATGVPSINRDWLARLKFFDPGPGAQKKIRSILQTIDQAIEKTEALIEKYQQIKAGLMHDLFTRGIGADGKLRPPREQASELYQETQIGWLPKEWAVETIRDLAFPSKGSTVIGPFGSDLVMADYRSEGVPVIFVRDVKEDGFNWVSNVFVSKEKAQKLFSHRVSSGDLLATKMGLPPCISVVYPNEMLAGIITADIIRMAVDKTKVDVDWLSSAINQDRVIRQVAAITAGVTRPKVTLADFRGLKVANPEIPEQRAINNVLSNKQRIIEVEKSNVRKLLKTKSGLMHDLLTGNVQVNPDSSEPSHV